MSTHTSDSQKQPATDLAGRTVPCPSCDTPTGVPLPQDSQIVTDAADGEGMSPTRCPNCDTRITVHYRT